MSAMIVPDFVGLARPAIRSLRAYDPGHDLVALRERYPDLLELGSNENSWGCSPRVAPALTAALDGLYRYPDPLGGRLKAALARKHGLETGSILLGNGSHELLMQIAQVFSGPGADVVSSRFGFAVYGLAAQAAGAVLRRAPAFPPDDPMPRGHDLDAIAAAARRDARLVFLANPNNPTGTWFSAVGLERMLASTPSHVLVVVDEAYAEFVDDPTIGSAIDLLADFPNLIVTRTFSKAYALAGLRVGYALAHPSLVDVMERVRESFNVNLLALAAAEAALADGYHLASIRVRNAAERRRVTDALRRQGYPVAPSQANFLLVDFGPRCREIESELLKRSIVLRPMGGYELPSFLRITIGRPDENDRLLAALDALA